MIRVIFIGTGDLACLVLAGLLKACFSVVSVFTTTRKGTQQEHYTYTSVERLSYLRRIPVYSDVFLYNFFVERLFVNLNVDYVVVVSSAVFLYKKLLALVRLCCVNVHYSLVPRFIGPAPVQYTRLCGDGFVGFSVLKMCVEMDSGPLICVKHNFVMLHDNNRTMYIRLGFVVVSNILKFLLFYNVNAVFPWKCSIGVIKKSTKVGRFECNFFLRLF